MVLDGIVLQVVYGKFQDIPIKLYNDMTTNSEYIYDLPYTVRRELSTYLDDMNMWENLALIMRLKPSEKDLIRRQVRADKSPSYACLDIWGGKYNHTVCELFILLRRMKLPLAMIILQDYVDSKYHKLIPLTNLSDVTEERKLINADISITNNMMVNSSNNNNIIINNEKQRSPRENVYNTPNSTDLSESKVLQDVKPIPEIDYNELTEGTNNWSDKNVLGKGGFGKVYKGIWRHSYVAIKIMDYKRPNGDPNVKVEIQQSLNELKHLMSRYHPNIVMLYGYCIKSSKPCLVYHLMKGGSLEQRIKAEKFLPLTWQQRFKICRDTAAGISFLHTDRDGKVIIHGDIKPGNILLDECLNAKIGDFGLAREIPRGVAVKVSQVFGTRGYLPPEYLKNKLLSETIDIYSFGIVLLETFTNKRTSNKQDLPPRIWKLLQNGSDLFDSRMPMSALVGEEFEMCSDMIKEALKCTADMAVDRPQNLELILKTFERYNNFR